MTTLDEDLAHRITYSPECQATFAKYKKSILRTLTIQLMLALFVAVLLYFFIPLGKDEPDNEDFLPIVITCSIFLIFLLFSSINNWRDLRMNRLDIQEDIFLNLKVAQTENGTEYDIQLQDAGHLGQPPTIRRIKKNTKVYVVRTAATKTLLDIIPIDQVTS